MTSRSKLPPVLKAFKTEQLAFVLGLIGFSLFTLANEALAQRSDLPQWARTYGTETPYTDMRYITGFAMYEKGEEADPLTMAKEQAAGDLIRKVRVTIRSEITSVMEEQGEQVRSSVASVNQSVTQLQIEGINFEVAEDRKRDIFYALAYLDRSKAAKKYNQQLSELWGNVDSRLSGAKRFKQEGKSTQALEQYLGVKPLLNDIVEIQALVAVIEGRAEEAFRQLSEETSNEERNIGTIHATVDQNIQDLLQKPSATLDQAVDALAYQLKLQGLPANPKRVSEMLYQESDFSSAFGTYAARKLSGALSRILSSQGSGAQELIIRGSYWLMGDEVELSVFAQALDGHKVASAEIKMPQNAVPDGYDLKPRNFQEAMADKQALEADALVEGGINVEVWTNKGRNESSVVFEEGDDVNLYFRVNQPSYLQMTYKLSNGAKVMLEEAFYIGMDKVNKVVRYPQTFVVAAPFGVERLIVTAYNSKPPKPDLVTKSFEGVEYEVIAASLKEYMVKTRGLVAKKTDKNEIRTGEANLTMTMVPRVQ